MINRGGILWSLTRIFREKEELICIYKRYRKHLPGDKCLKIDFFSWSDRNVLVSFAEFLNLLLNIPKVVLHLGLLHAFLEISGFQRMISTRFYIQTEITKKRGGYYLHTKCFNCIKQFFSFYKSNWIAITSDGVCYCQSISSSLSNIKEMLFFDKTVKVRFGRSTAHGRLGIVIYTSTRKLIWKVKSKLKLFNLLSALNQAILNCPYVSPNRFASFSPPRMNNEVTTYINAEGYYKELMKRLNSAQFEVFIRGWWVCPDIYLQRPSTSFPDSRLDRVLRSIAKAGVKVYIILFKEYEPKMYNDSVHAKSVLENLHHNIRIVRHPPRKYFFWSHHEKSIVIDQEIAFLGGIDLCHGRFEKTGMYQLSEYGGNSIRCFITR